MANNYPTASYPIPETQHNPNIYQEPSPASSASPTSPRMNDFIQSRPPNPYKQLRPLKSPLYVPAVLRPTEHFSTGPSTPPKSQHGSLDSLPEAERAANSNEPSHEEILHAAWADNEELGDVTGPPTRDHWKPDVASPTCDSPHCVSTFNLFVRKHHCRHCGHIFCSTHVTRTIPLDQEAKFHPDGNQSRACETCYRQYMKWDTARSMRRKNSQGSGSRDDESAPPTPGRRIGMGAKPWGQQRQQDMANSVPKDWSWSTF
jgi:hypothetical protein